MRTSGRLQDWMSGSRTRPYIVFLSLAILPLILFLTLASRAVQHEAEKRAFEDNAQIAKLTARLTVEKVTASKEFLDALASRPSLQHAWERRDLTQIAILLKHAAELRPDFVFVSVIDRDGTLRAIYPDDPEVVNRNFAFRDWYKGVSLHWEPYVSGVYKTAAEPHSLVAAIAVPIKDAEGRPLGILMAPYGVSTIGSWFQQTAPSASARRIEVIDQSSHVLASERIDSSSRIADLGSFELTRSLRDGREGQSVLRRDGEETLVAYVPIPRLGWGVLVEQPRKSIFLSMRDFTQHLVLLGVVFIVLAVVCGWFVASLYQEIGKRNEQIDTQNQQLQQSNLEVRQASNLKSQFLATMSHELRTPLNAILGFSELLQGQSAGPLLDKQQRWVEHIHKSGRHLLSLINDILNLSKIEAGKVEFDPERFSVNDVVAEVVADTSSLALSKRIKFFAQGELRLIIESDRLRFKQILYNLVSNAIKFTGEGGEVFVKSIHQGEMVRICVKDSGVGIDPENHKSVFDEFSQYSVLSGIGGTGLGLAITKRLVEHQGGKIWVESELGSGACFFFELPAAVATAEPEQGLMPGGYLSQATAGAPGGR